jgi:hypothetical protein
MRIISGANGLDGGYETHVACRGSITTLKDGTNTKANNELALAA